MFASIFLLIGGLFLLYLGGEGLVRGASSLALRMGVPALIVGLTVVAFGTSAPELVVSLGAALSGAGDVAVGNVVGSNIANIALILGSASLIRPIAIQARLVRTDVPIMLATALILVIVVRDGTISRVDGVLLLAGLVAFIWFTIRSSGSASDAAVETFSGAAPVSYRALGRDVAMMLAGVLSLSLGGRFLVDGAVALATLAGLSQAVIGLSIVAFGTSLPELATCIVAGSRGEGDLAVGGVIGSNVLNVLGILGFTTVIVPLSRGGVDWLDLGFMLVLTVLMLPFMRSGFRLTRAEGAILVSLYVAYVTYLLLG